MYIHTDSCILRSKKCINMKQITVLPLWYLCSCAVSQMPELRAEL